MYLNAAKTIASVTNVVNNGSGLCRVTATAHGLVTGNKVWIANVFGTTEANGYWTVTRIDDNTIDLQSSTFTNAYSAGGTVSLVDRISAKLAGAITTNPVTVQLNVKTFDFSSQKVTNIARESETVSGATPVVVFTQTTASNTQSVDLLRIINDDTANATATVEVDNGKGVERMTKVLLEPGFVYTMTGNGISTIVNADGRNVSDIVDVP